MDEGSTAASAAIAAFITELLVVAEAPLPSALDRAVRVANSRVYKELVGRGGTTLTAVALKSDGQACAAHVGDSRLYVTNSSGSLELLSQDDTLQGVLRNQNGGNGNEDNLDNRLLQFVGIGPDLEPHVFPLEAAGEKIWILTTDGMHGLGRKILEGVAERVSSPVDLVRKVCFVADAVNVRDNASIAVLTNEPFEPWYPGDDGYTIAAWTPGSYLELWLPPVGDLKVTKNANFEPETDHVADNSGKKVGSPKRRKRTSPPKSSRSTRKKTVPQLDIQFGTNIINND